jgi:hypothetical protein
MTIHTKPKLSSASPQQPIQTIQQPSNWSASLILYKKISFSTTTDGLQIFYHRDSQSRYGTNLSIADFLNSLSPESHGLESSPSPLDFKILGDDTYAMKPFQGYLIFELDKKANWHFQSNVPPVTTSASNPDYFNLMWVPDSGGGASATPIDNCHMLYFQFNSPSANGALTEPVVDTFNLYVSVVNQVNNSSLNITIDPDITNTGGPPDHGGGPKRKRGW